MPGKPPKKRPFRDTYRPYGQRPGGPGGPPRFEPNPPLRPFTTTLWEYPSQHYQQFVDEQGALQKAHKPMQGHRDYIGATPSWVIWQVLMRYTTRGETVVDPMCGSGTTIAVCEDLGRVALCFDLVPSRPDIRQNDARRLPLADASADFVFIDPPYSTHVNYSDDPRCIGKLDAARAGEKDGYFAAMDRVIGEIARVLRPGGHMALYVSDSWRKESGGVFMPIGFDLFEIMRRRLTPVDIIAVARRNQKLDRPNWHRAAEEQNFFLRGFNYLFIMQKPDRSR